MKPAIAVDFDGVLARYDKFRGMDKFDKPIDGAKEFMQGLRQFGRVVVHSARVNRMNGDPVEVKKRIIDWLEEHGVPYDEVWWGNGKPIAFAYVDDRAVECRPQAKLFQFEAATQRVAELRREVAEEEGNAKI